MAKPLGRGGPKGRAIKYFFNPSRINKSSEGNQARRRPKDRNFTWKFTNLLLKFLCAGEMPGGAEEGMLGRTKERLHPGSQVSFTFVRELR